MKVLKEKINEKLKKLEQILGRKIDKKHRKLFVVAITHSSFSGEFPEYRSNERLEFLGDSVISLAITHYLFEHYPKLPEGELSKKRAYIVSEKGLSEKAIQLDLGDALLFGKGEEKNGGKYKKALLADALESVVAAVFLAYGFKKAECFVWTIFKEELEKVRNIETTDYKTKLQEIVQREFHDVPAYRIVSESGSPANKRFVAEVKVKGKTIGSGEGGSKKDAEENAAKEALESEFIRKTEADSEKNRQK
jgi:ribonuclease-3